MQIDYNATSGDFVASLGPQRFRFTLEEADRTLLLLLRRLKAQGDAARDKPPPRPDALRADSLVEEYFARGGSISRCGLREISLPPRERKRIALDITLEELELEI